MYGREWTVCILFDPKKSGQVEPALLRKPLFASYGENEIKDNLQLDRQIKVTY